MGAGQMQRTCPSALFIAALYALAACTDEPPPARSVLGHVPEFGLVDQNGQPFGSRNLAGKVWAASFIFTRCPTVCPRLTEKMARIQRGVADLGDRVHLVSFSVDPSFDTPEVLATYAARHGAKPRLWSFLTGPLESVRQTVVGGLKVGMDGAGGDPARLVHGTHFVVVDAQLRIRGTYDSGERDAVGRVVRDLRSLAGGSGR